MAPNDSLKTVTGRRTGAPDPDAEKDREKQFQRQVRSGLGYLVMGLLAAWLVQQLVLQPLLSRALEIPYSEFKSKLAAGQIVDASLGRTIDGVMKNPSAKSPQEATVPFETVAPPSGDPDLLKGARCRPCDVSRQATRERDRLLPARMAAASRAGNGPVVRGVSKPWQ